MDTSLHQLGLLLLVTIAVSGLCPENLQYGNEECCSKCGPGYGVETQCSQQNDTSCEGCVEGETFSASWSYYDGCSQCSKCIKNAHVATACNVTHDAVCECNPNFFYDPENDMCKLCEPCAPGSGASRHCNSMENTICEVCANDTFSDVLSATADCLPCSVCNDNQVMLQACSAKQDTICLDISPPKPTVAIVQSKAKTVVGSEGINVIPLYCALMAAIVVGLLVYVIVKNVRRGKDAKRIISKQPHDDIEYAAAEKGDSGIFLEPEVKSFPHSLKLREIPYNRRRDVEQSLCIQKDKRANWKILARELGFNRDKVETLENQAEIEMIEPAVYMLSEWCKNDCATVGAFLRALKKVGRTDIARVLNGDTSELRPLNDGCSH